MSTLITGHDWCMGWHGYWWNFRGCSLTNWWTVQHTLIRIRVATIKHDARWMMIHVSQLVVHFVDPLVMTGCSTPCTLFEITELLAFARGCYEKKVKRYLTWNGYSNSQVRASGRILFLYRTLMRNYKPLRLTTVKQVFTAFREWRLYMVIWAWNQPG